MAEQGGGQLWPWTPEINHGHPTDCPNHVRKLELSKLLGLKICLKQCLTI